MAESLPDQQLKKLSDFQNALAQIQKTPAELELRSLGEGFLRERLDFTWTPNAFGLKSKTDSGQIADLEKCFQISSELQDFLTEFRKIKWPVQKASVRLRIGPKNRRGMWLDFANLDVKKLFEESHCLEQALSLGFVEVGQRRKKLVLEDRFRLQDPEFQIWTESFSQGQAIPLYSCVGSFTQTGRIAQKQIAQSLENFLDLAEPEQISEFGCGIGTLTMTAAGSHAQRIYASDFDELALHALDRSLVESGQEKVRLQKIDFHQKHFELDSVTDTLIINPARSGSGKLFSHLPKELRSIIYMSCYPESFFKDIEPLLAQGFRVSKAVLIDQFPQTPHAEWMSLIQRH